MEQDYTATEKQIYAILLAVGLLYVFAKVAYQYFTEEKFTVYNVFHPVKSISAKERQFISKNILPYQYFNQEEKKRFLKRFAWFKSKKRFAFRGEIENKDEIKAYVSASATLVTMGLQDFRFEKSISRVVVYPSEYYSRISARHHIGEYNPRLRVLVFSIEALKKGFQIPNDNINLGIHEVAHALMIETHKKTSWEAMRFKVGLRRLKSIFDTEDFQERLKKDQFFRAYGKTNFHEFFAVLVEHFIENPKELEKRYSQMHSYLKRMLNLNPRV